MARDHPRLSCFSHELRRLPDRWLSHRGRRLPRAWCCAGRFPVRPTTGNGLAVRRPLGDAEEAMRIADDDTLPAALDEPLLFPRA